MSEKFFSLSVVVWSRKQGLEVLKNITGNIKVETLFSVGDNTPVDLTDENTLFAPKSLLSRNWFNVHVLAYFLESAADLWKTLDEKVKFLYVLHDCNSYTADCIPMVLDSILLLAIHIWFRTT
jgi:hypothetical protein